MVSTVTAKPGALDGSGWPFLDRLAGLSSRLFQWLLSPSFGCVKVSVVRVCNAPCEATNLFDITRNPPAETP